MRSDPFPPIYQRAYCCCHLHRCHLKRLSKRHRCQLYLPYVFLLVHDRCSLSRKIYTCLPHQSEFFKIFIKILCSKPHPYFNKNRITGILHPLYKSLRSMSSRPRTPDPTVFHKLVSGTVKSIFFFDHSLFQRRRSSKYLKDRSWFISIIDTPVPPHLIQHCLFFFIIQSGICSLR